MQVFRRHVALPSDHGSWAFFLAPLAIGLFAGGRWHTTALYLTVAAACGFLVRQPVGLLVKIHAGRRPKDALPAAWFWVVVYTWVGSVHVAGLIVRGFGYLLYLAIPGVLVFTWYLTLLSRREERRQGFLEVLATGSMALIAPAGMWAGLGRPDPLGWLLWLLVWAQSASAIVFVYYRLARRQGGAGRGVAAFSTASFAVLLAAGLGFAGLVSRWLFVPFLVQWLETVRGLGSPATDLRPTAIGIRQLVVKAVFTVLFILLW